MGAVDAVEWACGLCGHCIQNDWVEQQICIKFWVKLQHSSQKLLRWFRRLQLWATGDWQVHHDNVPAHASQLMQNFLAKHQITQETQPPYSPDLAPATSGFSQNWNHLWKGRDFRPSVRLRKTQWGSGWRFGELCELPRCILWRGLKPCCPMYNVSCIFFNKFFHLDRPGAGILERWSS